MRVYHRPWIRQAFPKMRWCIAFNGWMQLRSSISDVGDTIRIQQKCAITRQDTIAMAKLRDESSLTGPFPHPDAGKGIKHG
jgi:hypothetical protein